MYTVPHFGAGKLKKKKKSPWLENFDLGTKPVEDYIPPRSYDDLIMYIEDKIKELEEKISKKSKK